MRANPSHARRGVLLLVILGLLAMFGLVAIAFVVLTGHEQRNAKQLQRMDEQYDPPQQLLEGALFQVLRGTNNRSVNNPGSVIGPHGLLEDLYGADTVIGTFDGTMATELAAGQLIEFDAAVITPEIHAGSVLTMLEGPAAGRSTRIVGHVPAISGNSRFQIVAFDDVPFSQMQMTNSTYLINGTPFGGTGFGYNPLTGGLDRPSRSGPVALLPNHPANWAPTSSANEDYDAADFQNMMLAAQAEVTRGGQTILASIPSMHRPALVQYLCKTNSGGTDPNPSDPGTFENLFNGLPDSLKRWITMRPLLRDHPKFTGSNPAHVSGTAPYATGFNPLWDGIPFYRGTDTVPEWSWDVDNDGDGQTDSIWVDLGLPARATADGRLYKPLFAILCVDLDGRLNLNAHGCLAQTEQAYYDNIALPTPTMSGGSQLLFADSSPVAMRVLPRGQGYGPADINLAAIFPLPEYVRLLQGNNVQPGRYGLTNMARPGIDGVDDPLSQNKCYDYFNEAWWSLGIVPQNVPYDYWGFLRAVGYPPNGYGMPPDPIPDGALALDPRGQPLCPLMGEEETIDDPYEIDLSRNAVRGVHSPNQRDDPFTAAEVERILRPYDADAARLPARLINLAPSLGSNPRRRMEITGDSWDLPTPSVVLTTQQRADAANSTLLPDRRAHHAIDLFLVKLEKEYRPSGTPPIPNQPLTPAEMVTIRTMVRHLVSPETLAGLKMDVNRPFGNGLDDSSRGRPGSRVVDEPFEVYRSGTGFDAGASSTEPREFMPQVDANRSDASARFNHIGAVNHVADVPGHGDDVNGDGQVNNADRALVRQLYARHLYVLALLALDHTVANPNSPTAAESERAQLIAQWAVNAVDFRDRDSIMTPFEYDISPFTDEDGDGNPWDVDSFLDRDPTDATLDPPSDDLLARYRGLVWGCERPELLITETLAFHDRRTEDTDQAGDNLSPDGDDFVNNPNDPPPQPPKDTDFDQRRRPEGSLFIELYNPWPAIAPKPGELYTDNRFDSGVALTNNGPNNSPVWRMTIHRPSGQNWPDPDDPTVVPERSVYFVNAQGISVTGDGQRHYPKALVATVVKPGRYAVIGPGNDPTKADPELSCIGFRTDVDPFDGNIRRIELWPAAGTETGNQVRVENNEDSTDSDQDLLDSKNQIQPPMAVRIDATSVGGVTVARRLSVSEPPGGYPAVDPLGNAYDDANHRYISPFDEPLDARADPQFYSDKLVKNETHTGEFKVHLQRLANPLRPWHRITNPYRTIDSMPIDLTTFNGVSDTPGHEGDETGENGSFIGVFASRERGEHNDANHANNLWSQETANRAPQGHSPPPVFVGAGNHEFKEELHHSLGYLNWFLNDGFVAAGPRDNSDSNWYMGDPRGQPFPWLTWNDRPFTSQLELLLVPTVNSRDLLLHDDDAQGPPISPHFGMRGADNPYAPNNFLEPYSHLLNFFSSEQFGAQSSPELHRMLEFLHVPSRFVGTEIQGNPAAFVTAPTVHGFWPPFNWISRYREPGRINLNTIYSQSVFDGLMNGFPNGTVPSNSFWVPFRTSRQSNAAAPWEIDPDVPTRFAGVFRSSGGGSMVPPVPGLQPTREINATLLREDPDRPGEPLFGNTSTNNYNNTDRNPYFRYQGIQRLGNLTTTRSNVYAIWITVGYFEVSAGDVDPQHPDGYRLGQELGIDTGEVERHRGFYMIDRSIPVGFQRGQDLNVEKTILLRRFIE